MAPWRQSRFRYYGSPRNYLIALSNLLSGRLYAHEEDIALLEAAVAARLGVPYALAVPQGRVGLYLTLKALIQPGQDVVMSPYTIYDVVNMVLAAGGRPVFADVQQESGNIDPKAVQQLIGQNTGAVLVTHLHGLAADMTDILAACAARNIPVIEDVAQAFGGTYQGRPLGSLGAAAVLSFGRVKNINGFFGGMVVTSDKGAFERMKAEMDQFVPERPKKLITRIFHCLVSDIAISSPVFPLFSFWVFRYGCIKEIKRINKLVQTEDSACRRDSLPTQYCTRMTPMQARIILTQLNELDSNTRARIANAKRYAELLNDLSGVILPPRRSDGSHIYLAYPVQVFDRWSLVKSLMVGGNDLAIQHIGNTADLPCFKEFYRPCPVAAKVANEMVLLPCYPGYRSENIDRMVRGLKSWLRSA